MKTKFQLVAIALCSIAFFTACQKEMTGPDAAIMEAEINAVSDQGKTASLWTRIESVPSEPILNLAFENGQILATGKNHRYYISPGSFSAKSDFFGVFNEDYSTCLNQEFFTKISGSRIFVYNTRNPLSFAMLDLAKLDPGFGGFSFLPGYLSKSIAMNQNNYFLTVYNSDNSGLKTSNQGPQMVIFRAVTTKSGEVELSDVRLVPVKPGESRPDLLNVFATGERFLVSMGSKTYVVCQQGQYEEVFAEEIYEVIPYNDVLLGFGQDQLLYSKDQGLSWLCIMRKGPAAFSFWMQKGFQVGDCLITSSPTELFKIELDLQNSMVNIQPLPASELELDKENLIYQKIRAGNYMVVATSTGLYYRSIAEFLPRDRK